MNEWMDERMNEGKSYNKKQQKKEGEGSGQEHVLLCCLCRLHESVSDDDPTAAEAMGPTTFTSYIVLCEKCTNTKKIMREVRGGAGQIARKNHQYFTQKT